MSDDLLTLAASLSDDRPAKLQGTMTRALQFDPTAYAKAVRTAAQTGVVPSAILQNQKEFDEAAVMPDPNEFVNMSPKAAQWLISNVDNAPQAHDDLSTLQKLELAFGDMSSQITQIPQRTMGSLFRSIGGMATLEGSALQQSAQPDAPLWTKALSFLVNPLRNPDLPGDLTAYGQAVRDYYKPLFTDPALVPKTTAGNVAEFAGGIAGTMGKATLATMLGGPFGAPALFGSEAAGEGGGGAIERGATPGQATVKAVGSGGLNAALAFIPGGKFGSEESLANAFAQSSNWGIAGEMAKGITARTARGVALGTGVTAAENLLSMPYAPDTKLMEGWKDNVASFIGLEGAGYLNHAMQLTAESKLKARAPDTFQDAATTILKDTPAENVMIPADRLATYFQAKGLDPTVEAARIGAKNYPEALAAGTDVEIPTANFLAKLQPEDHEALLPDLRTSPDAMTQREAEAHIKAAPARVAQLVEDAKAEFPDAQFQAFATIKAEFQQRLEDTGRFTPAIAEDNAALIAKGLVNQSMREGLDPFKEMERYGLSIIGPGGEGSPMRPAVGPVPDHLAAIPGLEPSGQDFLIPTDQLTADPSRFQYKGRNETTGLNQVSQDTGASGSLAGVKVWNPDTAGTISVWHDGGKTYVVNGHNRYDLAQRLDVARMKARFIDAKSADEARIAGAVQNIAAGKGTAMDAGTMFREGKYTLADLERLGIPTNKDVVVKGLALSRLSEPWFQAAKSDPEFERLAVETGKAGLSPEQQGVALQELNTALKKKGAEDISSAFWRDMLDRIKGSKVTTSTEQGLFGAEDTYQSTLEQQTDLVRFIRSKLRTDKTVGQVLTGGRYEDAVGKAATVDKAAAKGIKDEAGNTLGIFEGMKNLTGVGDVINEYAAKLQQARSAKEADAIRSEALAAVKDSIKEMQGNAPKVAPAEEGVSLFQSKNPEQIKQEAHDLYNDPRTEEDYAKLPGTEGGKKIDIDLARKLDPNYLNDPANVAEIHHEEVSAFANRLFAARMAMPKEATNENVVFLAGGGGSGKGTIESEFNLGTDAQTLWDGAMSSYGTAKEKIEQALRGDGTPEGGRRVAIDWIYRPIEKAVNGTIERAHVDEHPRTVGLDHLAKAHEGSPAVMLWLMDDYAGDPRVMFRVFENAGKLSDLREVPQAEIQKFIQDRNLGPEVANRVKTTYDGIRERGYEAKDGSQNPIRQDIQEVLDRSRNRLDEGGGGRAWGQNPSGSALGSEEGGSQVTLNQPGDNRGSITFGPDNKVAISVLEKADASTFVHELGHFWLKMQSDLAARPEATEQQKADLATILKWMGVSSPSEITTEHHEQFARAHEAYLREGKAPSQEMQSTFARFKTWLSAVYQRLTSLHVNLSEDVKGVFDRIYASDAEIEAAKQQMGGEKPIFETPEKAGMTPDQFDAYNATRARADEGAKAALAAQLIRESQRDQLQWWKDELAKVKDQVAAQVDEDPVQKAFKALADGQTQDGQPIKLSKQALVDQFGEGILKDLPRHGAKWVYDAKGGGMDAESASEMLGFKSGTDLVESLKAMAPRNERIQVDADLLMKQKHGDMLTDGSLANSAVEALHNADREKALMLELKSLRKLQDQATQGKAEARAAVKEIPPLQTFRDAAKELVDQTSVRDMDSNRYIIASRKASREAFEAMAKDDFQAAGDAKQKELLNHFLYLEAVKAKEEAQGIADYGKEGATARFQGMLGKAEDAQEQWNALAGRYEFSRVPYKELDARKSLESWAAQQTEDGQEIAFDPAMYNETRAKNWREVPMSELRAVKDALKNIETIARRQNQVQADGKQIDFETAVKQMQARARQSLESKAVPIGGSTLSLAEKIGSTKRTANAALLPMEQLIDWMDGGDVTGPWHQMLMNRASESQNKEHDLALKLAVPIQEALKAIPDKTLNGLLDFTGIRLPGMDRDLNRKQLISIAMNRGNEQNWEKLLYGRGWTSMKAQGELGRGLDMLTRPEWEFVQKTWDAMESLRPEVGDLQRKMTGIEPQWVEAKPFLAKTEDGGTLDMRGGYYPLVAERGESSVGMRQDIDASKSVMDTGSGYVRASTSTGYTKDRTKATYPLLLDFEQIVTQHASKVAKDLAYREFLVDANKLVTDQRVRNAIRETLGPEYEKQFMPWLRYQANNRNGSAVQGMDDLSRWMMQLRSNTVVATMGFNLGTSLIQFSGVTRAQHYVDGIHLMRAYSEFLAHPVDTTRMVRALSGEMANRGENYDRDMASVMRNELPQSLAMSTSPAVRNVVLPAMKVSSEVAKLAFHGILLADVALGIPTWLGAYRQGLATHGDAERAILEGDRAVRMTLPAAGAKDLPPIMRNNGFWKTATMFYGHFTKLYSNLADAQHQAGLMAAKGNYLGATGQAASTALLTVLIPALLGAYTKNRGPNEDENKAEWAILESLHFAASSIPILRNIADSLKSGQDFKFSPMFGAFEQQVKAIRSTDKAVEGEGDWSQAGFDAAAAFGQTAGIPGTTQALKPLKYLHGLSTGTQPTPENNFEYAKNLAFGPPPKGK